MFNDEVQQKRLSEAGLSRAARGRSRTGSRSTPSVADAVASALKDWAVEHGATHYTHWFQPLTGITAEKHDSFLTPTERRQGGRRVLAARSWCRASPTPRASRRAACAPRSKRAATRRGIRRARRGCSRTATAVTLVIPTAFVSWTGEALDKKTPLLRSMEALSRAGGPGAEAVRLDGRAGA